MNDRLEYPVIKNASVVDSVKDWITDQLIRGNMRPGDKLPTENELCAHLGASRNSVREAIKQLEAYGVVYIKRAEGTFVSSSFDAKMLSPVLYSLIFQENNWQDFVDLRRAIDIGTLYVLMDKDLPHCRLELLEDALRKLEQAVDHREPDVSAVTEADCAFHSTLISLVDNPQLTTLSDYINRITVPSREETTRSVIAVGKIREYKDLHRQIFSIVEKRDKASIEAVIRNHYIFWEKYR